ncbi:MAG TPA: pre-peptidase C-terminal domain-containing protein [Phycisphaerae bacterium]|nr:pre-peptidase C-terminal domain-containing protein [Phycisphaerae bacterium]
MRKNVLATALVLALAAVSQAAFTNFDTAGNNTPATADNITNNGTLLSNPCSLSGDSGIGTLAAGDQDYFRVDLTAGCYVNLETTPMTVFPTTPDTVMEVLNSALTQIALNDDAGGVNGGGTNRGSAIHLLIPATGTYYVHVYGFNNGETGSYLFTAGVSPEPATLALLGAGLLVLARRRK